MKKHVASKRPLGIAYQFLCGFVLSGIILSNGVQASSTATVEDREEFPQDIVRLNPHLIYLEIQKYRGLTPNKVL